MNACKFFLKSGCSVVESDEHLYSQHPGGHLLLTANKYRDRNHLHPDKMWEEQQNTILRFSNLAFSSLVEK